MTAYSTQTIGDFDAFLDTFGESARLSGEMRARCVREFVAGREDVLERWHDRGLDPEKVPGHIREEYRAFAAAGGRAFTVTPFPW